MSKPDKPLLSAIDIRTAIGLLSRLPVKTDGKRAAAAAWAFPLVGLITGAIAALIGSGLMALGVSASLTAGISLLVLISVTGAMHEDGLADTVDGFWGGWDKARRLEIMKDSHIGTYGVIALVLSLMLRWTALTALAEAGMLPLALIAVAALSRAPMVVLMAGLPHARKDGLSARVGRVKAKTAIIAVGLASLVAIALLGWSGIIALSAVFIAGIFCALIVLGKIGGQTGDVLGATQQISEIAALITLTTLII